MTTALFSEQNKGSQTDQGVLANNNNVSLIQQCMPDSQGNIYLKIHCPSENEHDELFE
jgi:hypothetical protein